MLLSTGGMISRFVSISGIQMCCIFWIFWTAEANLISQMAGSTVKLTCSNKSINQVNQLMWQKNGQHLFVFKPNGNDNQFHNEKSTNQTFKMSTSANEMYALIIERAQKSHTGNYTCDTITKSGPFQKNWELLITEEAENVDKVLVAVAAAVPCGCFLIVLSVFIILRRVRKLQAENNAAAKQQQREEIYENSLEIRRQEQASRLKHSTH
ncbi:uncharacterized protein LOC121650378 isoform X2 [Melanotaenia boesemani]|uniref:uncharacterized protein LOC121650378 isoform X2 n=1 Tax=Melanotaenia boesemani TaxID=1250792 RepID=UPI001C041516|nr:uncharacterized protein LOC121650378 isoform X2 [Melanotaenia boesemani]